MAVFPLLEDTDGYFPDTIDMGDPETSRYWLDLYEQNMKRIVRLAAESEGNKHEACVRAESMGTEFNIMIARIRHDSFSPGNVSILDLARHRQQLLLKYGFMDPFSEIKRRENEAALLLFPSLLSDLDALSGEQRLHALLECVLSGNIFDLGAPHVANKYEAGKLAFDNVRAELPSRPWLIDDVDRIVRCLTSKTYRKVVLFVDNAGADFLLGIIPFTIFFLEQGTEVIIAANSQPALNDITAVEAANVIAQIAKLSPTMCRASNSTQLVVVPSGNDIPMIDLRRVSNDLVLVSDDADMVVIEGMGRALESNYFTKFRCDCLKIAMIKDVYIARMFRGKVYDLVCRFEQVGLSK